MNVARIRDSLASIREEIERIPPAETGADASPIFPRLLSVVPEQLRPEVAAALEARHRGLTVLAMFADYDRPWAKSGFPAVVIRALLDDSQALPDHDCRDCGMRIPIHAPSGYPRWAAAVILFPLCPGCGGETGLLIYPDPVIEAFRKLPIDRQVKICRSDSEREYFNRAVAEGREP